MRQINAPKPSDIKQISFCTLDDECPYLPEKLSRMEYKFIQNCSKELNQDLVNRGWRRFGSYFSRPICEDCNECVGLRVDALNFTLSKSHKRVIRKNADTQIIIKKPNLSNEHLFLHEKYHDFMRDKRGWKINSLDFRQYFNLYVDGAFDFGYELDFFIGEKLICVDLIDILKDGISSIYCFYDPEFNDLSLGKFSLLNEIAIAKTRGLPYIYLGYFVAGCKSLRYKADYTPNEILKHTSSLGEEASSWGRYDSSSAKFGIREHQHR